MVRVIGVGDNTVDQYLHLGIGFPGGNSVNVPVYVRRLGHQASYIGWLGNDKYGTLLLNSLKEEGVDCNHCRVIKGGNARSEISLVNGDRVFGHHEDGVSNQIRLNDDDILYIKSHDILHTSIYSDIEHEVPRLKDIIRISFDFSQNWTKDYFQKVLRWVNIAFLSHPHNSLEELDTLVRWIHDQGPEIVVVTLGSLGALAFDGKEIYRQVIKKVNVVDTLGAGDAFAARFLVETSNLRSIHESLELAAESAAEVCTYHGAFGHGVKLEELTN